MKEDDPTSRCQHRPQRKEGWASPGGACAALLACVVLLSGTHCSFVERDRKQEERPGSCLEDVHAVWPAPPRLAESALSGWSQPCMQNLHSGGQAGIAQSDQLADLPR